MTHTTCNLVGLLCSGRNNQFLTAARANVAITYNDISVLENFHCAETFTIAHRPECDLFESMEAGQYTHFRKLVVTMTLATVRSHFEAAPVRHGQCRTVVWCGVVYACVCA